MVLKIHVQPRVEAVIDRPYTARYYDFGFSCVMPIKDPITNGETWTFKDRKAVSVSDDRFKHDEQIFLYGMGRTIKCVGEMMINWAEEGDWTGYGSKSAAIQAIRDALATLEKE